MNKLRTCLWLLFFSCVSEILPAHAQSSRVAWFQHDRFGMFIHWGLYSGAEGLWRGEPLRYPNDYAEWIQYRNRIPKNEYSQLAKRFVWNKINPDEWVRLAKEAGMKYIIITAKHHDGVAIWDTKVNGYSLPDLSGSHCDVLKELAAACHKYGIKLGFYYSQWLDWGDPDGWNYQDELTGKVTPQMYNQYWEKKVIPQLRELLTNYGKISIIWFDMWIPYQKTIVTKEQLEQAARLIRKLQPDCLINSRIGLPDTSEYVDFQTMGDNSLGTAYTAHPWATPGTIENSWGYNGQDEEWKSTIQLLSSLIGNVSLNGNFTLNIGPRADGSVPYEEVSRLKDIGQWLKAYGECIYGCTGLPLRAHQEDWGDITFNKENKNIYLEIFNWPLDQILRVSGIESQPEDIELLRRNEAPLPLHFEQTGPLLHIFLPDKPGDNYVSVIRIRNKEIKLDKNIVPESTFGGFALRAKNVLNQDSLTIVRSNGVNPTYINTQGKEISWDVYLPHEGNYQVDISAHNPTKEIVPIEIHIGDQILTGKIKPSGKVVEEPLSNQYAEDFEEHPLGEVHITKPGEQRVTFKVKNSSEFWLNRIWIESGK